jgi:hypothetical protein
MLAVRVLLDQNIEMTGITFQTPFFGPEGAQKAARQLGIPLRVIDIGAVHLEMLKNPKYGYGSQMNPCIDCHALMLKTAGGIMDAEEFDFLCTGEVLGQRPMSQRKDALRAVDKLSGYGRYILRPLSAKLLWETVPEELGKVDRQRLLSLRWLSPLTTGLKNTPVRVAAAFSPRQALLTGCGISWPPRKRWGFKTWNFSNVVAI